MGSDADRGFPKIMAIPFLGVACCIGIPLALAAGAGGVAWIIGAGVPIVAAVALGSFIVERSRRRRRAARAAERGPHLGRRQLHDGPESGPAK